MVRRVDGARRRLRHQRRTDVLIRAQDVVGHCSADGEGVAGGGPRAEIHDELAAHRVDLRRPEAAVGPGRTRRRGEHRTLEFPVHQILRRSNRVRETGRAHHVVRVAHLSDAGIRAVAIHHRVFVQAAALRVAEGQIAVTGERGRPAVGKLRLAPGAGAVPGDHTGHVVEAVRVVRRRQPRRTVADARAALRGRGGAVATVVEGDDAALALEGGLPPVRQSGDGVTGGVQSAAPVPGHFLLHLVELRGMTRTVDPSRSVRDARGTGRGGIRPRRSRRSRGRIRIRIRIRILARIRTRRPARAPRVRVRSRNAPCPAGARGPAVLGGGGARHGQQQDGEGSLGHRPILSYSFWCGSGARPLVNAGISRRPRLA